MNAHATGSATDFSLVPAFEAKRITSRKAAHPTGCLRIGPWAPNGVGEAGRAKQPGCDWLYGVKERAGGISTQRARGPIEATLPVSRRGGRSFLFEQSAAPAHQSPRGRRGKRRYRARRRNKGTIPVRDGRRKRARAARRRIPADKPTLARRGGLRGTET